MKTPSSLFESFLPVGHSHEAVFLKGAPAAGTQRRLIRGLSIASTFILAVTPLLGQQGLPAWRDVSLPFEERAADLVSRLTTGEKISQLVVLKSPAIERVGIPAFCWWWEALHGVLADGATVFPQAIGMGATWDTDLLFRIATAISDEGRAI